MRILLASFLVVLPVPAQAEAADTFCSRLAAQLGMSAERVKTGQRPRVWSTRALNLAQRFLVGGQAMVTMQMAPTAGAGLADYDRLSDACKSTGKTLTCAVQGPAELRLGINGKEARSTAAAGDKATVEMVGSRITCRDD